MPRLLYRWINGLLARTEPMKPNLDLSGVMCLLSFSGPSALLAAAAGWAWPSSPRVDLKPLADSHSYKSWGAMHHSQADSMCTLQLLVVRCADPAAAGGNLIWCYPSAAAWVPKPRWEGGRSTGERGGACTVKVESHKQLAGTPTASPGQCTLHHCRSREDLVPQRSSVCTLHPGAMYTQC